MNRFIRAPNIPLDEVSTQYNAIVHSLCGVRDGGCTVYRRIRIQNRRGLGRFPYCPSCMRKLGRKSRKYLYEISLKAKNWPEEGSSEVSYSFLLKKEYTEAVATPNPCAEVRF